MKRLFLFAVCMLGALNLFAQTKDIDVDPGAFTSIKVNDRFEVSIKQGVSYHVTVTINDDHADALVCSVEKSVLNLSVDEKLLTKEVKKLYAGKNGSAVIMKAEITVPSKIVSLTLNDRSVCRDSDDVFSSDQATITVTDNAVLKGVVINSTNASITVDKKSNSMFVVNATNCSVASSGSAVISLTQECKATDVVCGGSSSLTLYGNTSKMRCQAKGSSKSILNGSSPVTEFVLSGSTNINAVNLQVDDATVDMNGNCTLTEAATKNLSMTLAGGSTLIYSSNPSLVINKIIRSTVKRYGEQ